MSRPARGQSDTQIMSLACVGLLCFCQVPVLRACCDLALHSLASRADACLVGSRACLAAVEAYDMMPDGFFGPGDQTMYSNDAPRYHSPGHFHGLQKKSARQVRMLTCPMPVQDRCFMMTG